MFIECEGLRDLTASSWSSSTTACHISLSHFHNIIDAIGTIYGHTEIVIVTFNLKLCTEALMMKCIMQWSHGGGVRELKDRGFETVTLLNCLSWFSCLIDLFVFVMCYNKL